ncbi:MAG: AAA family ATPase [Ignavibacteria bacterium]|nr:MAG: AAA family ATPase [Ignavibacteria bacterium]
MTTYHRPMYRELRTRLLEQRRFIQFVAGARQVGKTTLVQQVVRSLRIPVHFASADEPSLKDSSWIAQQWERARALAMDRDAILVLDEIQKAGTWSETVKRLWDEDSRNGTNLKVVLLGSSPLLMQRGLSESLTGRFEVLRLPHWSAAEMQEAFGWSVEQYIYFGGYPGAAPLIEDETRWRRYVQDALIETTISRDVMLLTRIDKPALLRRVFELGCRYSGQILSYTKMLGQLQDAGNTTTLAHYLELLAGSGLLTGLQKYAGEHVRRRASSPKFQVYNTALISAQAHQSFEEARRDGAHWGRLVESAIGAHVLNSLPPETNIHYWRAGSRELDFVIRSKARLVALEVKSGRMRDVQPGVSAFADAFHPDRILLVGADGIPVNEFLRTPTEQWLS